MILSLIKNKVLFTLFALNTIIFLPAQTIFTSYPKYNLEAEEVIENNIEQQGINSTGYELSSSQNWFQGTFTALSWEEVKLSYREPDLSKQKPGQVLQVPCKEIRPDNFNRVHNFMVLGNSECGFITTYQNYEQPNDRELVHLFYIKLPALSKNKPNKKNPPLVFLTGGPGQANTSLPLGSEEIINILRTDRDYLLVDYRGTGMSTPTLACLPEMMKLYFEQGKNADTIRKEGKYDFLIQCRARLEKSQINTLNFSTRNIARDFKEAITALGYKKVDFQSVSYGTKVGLTILRDYPEIVRSMILDSVFPIEADGLGETTTSLFNPLDEMVVVCKKSATCNPKTFTENMEELLLRIENLANKSTLTYEANFYLIDLLKILSHTDFLQANWPMELEFLLSLNENEFESFVINRLIAGVSKYEIMYQYFGKDLGIIDKTRQTDTPTEIVEPGQKPLRNFSSLKPMNSVKPMPLLALSLLDEFVGLWYSINCEEEIMPNNSPSRPVYTSRYFSPSLVKTLNDSLLEYMNNLKESSCGSWNQYTVNHLPTGTAIKVDKTLEHTPVKSQANVLMLSSRLDFYTPLKWAGEVNKNLPNSYWYISEIGSHDVVGSDPCALTLIKYFLISPQNFIRQNRKGPTVSCVRYLDRLRYEMMGE